MNQRSHEDIIMLLSGAAQFLILLSLIGLQMAAAADVADASLRDAASMDSNAPLQPERVRWWEPMNAIGTMIVGAAVAYIAYEQHRTSREKLRFDMFEKRFDVYLAVRELLDHRLAEGDVTPVAYRKFFDRTRHSLFLLSPEIDSFLKELRMQSIALESHNKNSRNCPREDERLESCRRATEINEWFAKQGDRAYEVFAPHLRLKY